MRCHEIVNKFLDSPLAISQPSRASAPPLLSNSNFIVLYLLCYPTPSRTSYSRYFLFDRNLARFASAAVLHGSFSVSTSTDNENVSFLAPHFLSSVLINVCCILPPTVHRLYDRCREIQYPAPVTPTPTPAYTSSIDILLCSCELLDSHYMQRYSFERTCLALRVSVQLQGLALQNIR